MRLSLKPLAPCTVGNGGGGGEFSFPRYITAGAGTQPATFSRRLMEKKGSYNWEGLLKEVEGEGMHFRGNSRLVNLGKRWKEYQGIRNWDGLLDPLDDKLRGEILRYGDFVDATYKAFDFDSSSPTYASCLFPKTAILDGAGFPQTGYRPTKNLRATSGIQLPRWIEKATSWMGTESSWIGYVAVCQNKEEIARLGRRDVVIAYRGTATCLEWLENLRATLTPLPPGAALSDSMVERGFLSLYTSRTSTCPSLQDLVREEVDRLLQTYGDEPLSLTITGHSLGAALAILTAYDIKTTFSRAPLVTVVSFGGPRVGNRSFRCQLEKQGTKVLRIVNSDDLITKVPGFVIDGNDAAEDHDVRVSGLPSWIRKRVVDTQWLYADVGRELRLRSRDSSYLSSINVAKCHDLRTYLKLVDGFVSSKCPFRPMIKKVITSYGARKVG